MAGKQTSLIRIETKQKFDDFAALYKSTTIVAHFSAAWSDTCKQIDTVLAELLPELDAAHVTVCSIEAEQVPEVSLAYKIIAVPTVVFISNGKMIDRVDGLYVPKIVDKVRRASRGEPITSDTDTLAAPDAQPTLHTRLHALVNRHPCMVFMKGSPAQPRCGFSKRLMELLSSHTADFDTFDILTDEDVRQGLKEYSNWPTFPQVYLNGELVGGLDIVTEQLDSGELVLPKRKV